METILIYGGVFAVVVLVFGVIVSSREDRSIVDQRLGHILTEEIAEVERQKHAPVTDWLNQQAERMSWGEGLAKNLARADLKLKVGEYLALQLISISTVAVIGWFLFHQSILGAVLGGVGGFYLPGIYVKFAQGRRLVRFNDQLSDMLNLMVNGLRAGYSMMQAMEAVSRELPPPICDEFRRVVQEMQLGVPMERALDNLLRRVPSADVDLVVTAMNVQREVGGNLAEILDTISHTIRERVRIKGEIRVLTAQQIYSGRLLAILPVLLLLAMYSLNRDYVMYFFAEETKIIGYIALGAATLLTLSGYYVINRIGKIEV